MTAEALPLRVEGLFVGYGDRRVLEGLDLTLGAGDIYGLLGPNGAGKTTLIRTICGRVRSRGGSITIAGHSGRLSLRHIGLVPQELALYPHMTIRENLEVFGQLSGLSSNKAKQALVWASSATDIADRLDERVDILSGGWKRRVNIAAAILHRPALLILDEPTVGVALDARNSIHEAIIQLSHAGMGILLATHDLAQADALCTRVGFLRHGVIAPQGAPRQLVDDAFRSKKQIVLELRQPASESQSGALNKAGFTAANAGYTWMMMASIGDQSVERLEPVLSRLGIETREIRLREPGLENLFVELSRDAEGAA
ncbi:ABC transporter ATP-binding protein [Devosia albogilva]|uniref:ABC transporter ATP-binding protein n=1 Tax=Devosia albogilva TaxID=429726 RepID=A0ABW5QHH7_9HYPH